MMDPLISPEELVRAAGGGVAIVDARSGPDARKRYQARHLAGALHVDLDHDLAAKGEDAARGGRHPLPDPEKFAITLGYLGIGPHTSVVVYDDKGGANAAARFWWMMRAAGHEQVKVLDGGVDAAVAAGFPVASRPIRPTVRPSYKLDKWRTETVDADEVERASRDPKRVVIDVRDPVRYRGESDPFDPVPGHIPGAVNVPYATNLDASGRFLSKDELAAKYGEVIGDRDPADVVVQCGSGVTACHTLLAMARAGIEGPKLYVGSWSEWSRSGRLVAKGSEPG